MTKKIEVKKRSVEEVKKVSLGSIGNIDNESVNRIVKNINDVAKTNKDSGQKRKFKLNI